MNTQQLGTRFISRGTNFSAFNMLPRVPVSSITNTNANDTSGYRGFLGVPPGQSDAEEFTNYTTSLLTDATAPATASVVVNLINLPPLSITNNATNFYLTIPAFTNIPLPSGVYTDAQITELHLIGADNIPTPMQHLQIFVGGQVDSLKLIGALNEVPVYLAVRGGSPLVVTNEQGASWRLGLTTYRDIEFVAPLAVRGGLRTDATVSGSLPTLVNEEALVDFENIADRMMWLEDVRDEE
jgi:hypothetical protein